LIYALVTKSGFALPSRETENGFVPTLFCFVAAIGTKQSRASLGDEDADIRQMVRGAGEN
jgi:hypothetical protein